MTGSQRQHLRQLIDARVRESVTLEEAPFGVQRCAGCDGELDSYTDGCTTCWDRRARRARAQRERERKLLFEGRCRLCGEHAEDTYCHAHTWAANPPKLPLAIRPPRRRGSKETRKRTAA